MDFDEMIHEAKSVLEKSPSVRCYAVALLTDKGNLHIACCNTFNNCCEKTDDDFSCLKGLTKSEETRILKMAAVFKEGDMIDTAPLPCFESCQLVYDLNHDNLNAEVRLETVDPESVGSEELVMHVQIAQYLKEHFGKEAL